MLYKKR